MLINTPMPEDYYINKLYPLQDMVLASIATVGSEFYLTGGTALGRFYLGHRYSDDLDFFVNDAADFKEQVNNVVTRLQKDGLSFDIGATSNSFARLNIERNGVYLKVDFVNDVPFHSGDIVLHEKYGRVDNWRNILSNKISALSRLEAKDVADILFISMSYLFNWEHIIEDAKQKDLWVEPIEAARLIGEFPVERFSPIKWIMPAGGLPIEKYLEQIQHDIFYGTNNNLAISISTSTTSP